jgi:hypothetical protein
MTTIPLSNIKVSLPFKTGALPRIDPNRPEFTLVLGTVHIRGSISAKSARKIAAHQGGAVLQGRLVEQGGKLTLVDGGFSFFDARPVETTSPEAAGSPG